MGPVGILMLIFNNALTTQAVIQRSQRVHHLQAAGTLCSTFITRQKTMQTMLTLALWPSLTAGCVLLGGLLLHKRLMLLSACLSALLVFSGIAGIMAYRDYSWSTAVYNALPAGSQVIWQQHAVLAGHPWTRLYAPVTAVRTINQSNVTMEANGNQLLEFELQDFDLHNGLQPVSRQVMLNCERQDMVLRLSDGILIETLPSGDPLLRILCQAD